VRIVRRRMRRMRRVRVRVGRRKMRKVSTHEPILFFRQDYVDICGCVNLLAGQGNTLGRRRTHWLMIAVLGGMREYWWLLMLRV
jgi:hypothetical protein